MRIYFFVQNFTRILLKVANDRHNLSILGLTGNAINIFMPFLKLIDNNNPFTKILKSALNEIGFGSSQYFFPKRRKLRGELFRVLNLRNCLIGLIH